jgi:hypothetical protein
MSTGKSGKTTDTLPTEAPTKSTRAKKVFVSRSNEMLL